jgi:hypothetical protein
MKANRWLLASAIVAPALGNHPPAQAQSALRITAFVAGTLFLTQPPADIELERTSGGGVMVHEGEYRDAFTAGALIGVHFDPRWKSKAFSQKTSSELQVEEGLVDGRAAAALYMYSVHVNYHFPVDRAVAPYLSVEAGGEAWEHAIANKVARPHFLVEAGSGFDLRLSEVLGFRLDTRDCASRMKSAAEDGHDKILHSLLIGAGVSVSIPTR